MTSGSQKGKKRKGALEERRLTLTPGVPPGVCSVLLFLPCTRSASPCSSVPDRHPSAKARAPGSSLVVMEDAMAILSSDTLQSTISYDDSASSCMVRVLHFDGASKGNPGKAGAGAVLMTEDRRVVQGKWRSPNQKMTELCNEVRGLEANFVSFEMNHVRQEWNAEADHEAEMAATTLAGGMVSEERGEGF